MIPDFSGDFLNYESTNDDDICEIIDEGQIQYNDVLKKDMFNIKVKHNDKVRIWSPNNKQGKQLQEAFGMDTKDWVGKTFRIVHVDKKMLIKPIQQ